MASRQTLLRGTLLTLILQLRRETGDLLYTENPGSQLQLHSYGRSQWRRRGTTPRGHMGLSRPRNRGEKGEKLGVIADA
jgi:hypothetical protein